MSHYTKERNIITFHIDGVNGVYTFDLSNGVYNGLKGNPVKTCQKSSAIREMLRRSRHYHGGWSNLERVLCNMFEYGYTSHYPRFLAMLSGAERLDAIDFHGTIWYIEDYEYINNHFTELVKYMRENEITSDNFNLNSFKEWADFNEAKKKLGGLAEQINGQIYKAVTSHIPNITVEEWGVAIYYLIRGKYWDYEHGDCRNLADYILTCRTMEKQPQKVNNFMREYCETKKEYELRKTEFNDRKLRENYELRKEAFTFTYGNYSIVVPQTAQDIIDEGANMHHCVGGYVDRVVNNQTYIVFVRRTDTPDQCYLTCQVHTNGEIGQYYLAYDRTISTAEDRDFRTAFQTHLRANWN